MIKIKSFLSLALAFGSSTLLAQQCDQCLRNAAPNCKINNDQVFTVAGCTASVSAAWDGMSPTTKTQSCTATIPPAWMLVDFKADEVSNNNGSYQVSRYAAGTDIEYKKIIDEAYLTALDLAGKIADETERKEVEAKLNSEYKSRIEIYEKLKVNMDTVKAEVSATAHGSPIDRKRGWMGVNVSLRVMCVAPLDLLQQVKKTYGLDTQALGSINSITFSTSGAGQTYMAWRAVDRFTPCNTTQGAVSVVKVTPNQPEDVYIDQSMQVCYSLLPKASAVPKFSAACRGKFGEKIDVAVASSTCKAN